MSTFSQFDYQSGKPRPLWRGRLHLWAVAAWVPASAVLLLRASSGPAWVALSIYAVSVFAVFSVSAWYHRRSVTAEAQRRMARVDHSMIFVQIAGTYTPVCLLALPKAWGISLLCVVWGLAAVGVVMKVFGSQRLWYWANAIYGLAGCVAFVGFPVVYRSLDLWAFIACLGGGVAYGIGALVFYKRFGNRFPLTFGYHEYWHLFTVFGALAHYAMVWQIAGAV
jgi:hemolysin III